MKKLGLYFLPSLILSCQPAEYEPIPEASFAALPLVAISPLDNPTSEEKVLLGKLLFYDPVLSSDNSIACATCHHPSQGYADGRDVSVGFGGKGLGIYREGKILTSRNAPTILNAAFNQMNIEGDYDPATAPMFYDNRVFSLEEQCLEPIFEEKEMRGNAPLEGYKQKIEEKLARIKVYREHFYKAFGDSVPSLSNVAKAISSFERTLITPNSPFDKFIRGDKHALTERQIRGMEAFVETGCMNCHNGPMFSDYKLHVLGVKERRNSLTPDKGNGNYAFRTPTLRNLAFTAPYMHNGEYETLSEVMDFYEQRESEHPEVPSSELANHFLELNFGAFNRSRKEDIIEFIRALNDENFDREIPKTVPSGFAPGGN